MVAPECLEVLALGVRQLDLLSKPQPRRRRQRQWAYWGPIVRVVRLSAVRMIARRGARGALALTIVAAAFLLGIRLGGSDDQKEREADRSSVVRVSLRNLSRITRPAEPNDKVMLSVSYSLVAPNRGSQSSAARLWLWFTRGGKDPNAIKVVAAVRY